MKIKQLTLKEVHIPLRYQFAQANNKGSNQSASVVLELLTAQGIKGYGEGLSKIICHR